jgi:hypothetical protein
LGCRDKLVYAASPVLPLLPAAGFDTLILAPIKVLISDLGQGQADLDEGVPPAADNFLAGGEC